MAACPTGLSAGTSETPPLSPWLFGRSLPMLTLILKGCSLAEPHLPAGSPWGALHGKS